MTRELVAAGYSCDELSRLTKQGHLVHLRRGAYAWADGRERGAAELHRQLVSATLPLLGSGAVVSHLSAAVLHGLPVWSDRLRRVHATRDKASRGKSRGYVHLHAAPLDVSEVVRFDQISVTSLGRTVVDLGRSLPFDQAVTAGDAALRVGCSPQELSEVLARSRSPPGVAAARRVVAFSDGRSESAGESLSRVIFGQLGLPVPTLQHEVFDDHGLLVGRSDFCWEKQRTLGEFDGKIKYGRLLKPGQTPQEAVYQEKRREDALRDLGWQVVRWSWADLKQGGVIADRLQRAFDRGVRDGR